MTTTEIIANMDRSLAAIASERSQLEAARAELAGVAVAPRTKVPTRRRRTVGRSRDTATRVLAALDTDTARTAGDVAKLTGIDRKTASTTLSRLAGSGEARKADGRGYLRAVATPS